MIELPEARVLAEQINQTLHGKIIAQANANSSPHKFAWYVGDPNDYAIKLKGKSFQQCQAQSGMVEMVWDDMTVLFGDGTVLRYYTAEEKHPIKHQLQLLFTDGSGLYVTIAMYGGIWAFATGTFENPYYIKASQAIHPLSESFDRDYFMQIDRSQSSLSAKAFLATEQRIPGLGNGCCQDILWNAGIHPKRKVSSFTETEFERLYLSVKSILTEMTHLGGRDTEKDILGKPGGYATKMSKNGMNAPCPKCGDTIKKEAYMGGSIYYCPTCQPNP